MPAIPGSYLEAARRDVDERRHHELIFKAISSLLLLLIKHLRLNHIYQFEHMADHFEKANGIILLLKFFNQNLEAYLCSDNRSVYCLPACNGWPLCITLLKNSMVLTVHPDRSSLTISQSGVGTMALTSTIWRHRSQSATFWP